MFDKADQLPAHVGLGERVVENSLAPGVEGPFNHSFKGCQY